MLPAVSRVVQKRAEEDGQEVSSRLVWSLFESEFLTVPNGWQLAGYDLHAKADKTQVQFRVIQNGAKHSFSGTGHGLIEALIDGVRKQLKVDISVSDYDEHAMTPGTEAKALASILLEVNGQRVAACCIDSDSSRATLQATLSAIGRSGAVNERLRKVV
jgi:2-isopropylmalate synthase